MVPPWEHFHLSNVKGCNILHAGEDSITFKHLSIIEKCNEKILCFPCNVNKFEQFNECQTHNVSFTKMFMFEVLLKVVGLLRTSHKTKLPLKEKFFRHLG